MVPMHVTSLHIYPLKSGKGISLSELQLGPRGPVHDRIWMLVHADEAKKGLFITQRDKGCEALAHVLAIPADGLDMVFSAPGKPDLCVAYDELRPFGGTVEIWGEHCEAVDAGDEAADWFSEYLDRSCRLVRMPEAYVRETEPAYSKEGDQVGFADKYPIHVITEASFESLCTFIPDSHLINVSRFRPNIVLSGLQAFEEDVIHEVRIGDVPMEFVKPSIRCSLTTIDQEKGVSLSDEPLRTLGKMRKGKGGGLQGVFFGQNAIHRKLGTVKVGDPVEIISRKPIHPALMDLELGIKGSRE